MTCHKCHCEGGRHNFGRQTTRTWNNTMIMTRRTVNVPHEVDLVPTFQLRSQAHR